MKHANVEDVTGEHKDMIDLFPHMRDCIKFLSGGASSLGVPGQLVQIPVLAIRWAQNPINEEKALWTVHARRRLDACYRACIYDALEQLAKSGNTPDDPPPLEVVVSDGKIFCVDNSRLTVLKMCQALSQEETVWVRCRVVCRVVHPAPRPVGQNTPTRGSLDTKFRKGVSKVADAIPLHSGGVNACSYASASAYALAFASASHLQPEAKLERTLDRRVPASRTRTPQPSRRQAKNSRSRSRDRPVEVTVDADAVTATCHVPPRNLKAPFFAYAPFFWRAFGSSLPFEEHNDVEWPFGSSFTIAFTAAFPTVALDCNVIRIECGKLLISVWTSAESQELKFCCLDYFDEESVKQVAAEAPYALEDKSRLHTFLCSVGPQGARIFERDQLLAKSSNGAMDWPWQACDLEHDNADLQLRKHRARIRIGDRGHAFSEGNLDWWNLYSLLIWDQEVTWGQASFHMHFF